MRANVLPILFTFFALIVFGTAQAQNPHLASACIEGDALNVKIAGLGNRTFEFRVDVEAKAWCQNPGTVVVFSSSFKSGKQENTRNGNFTFPGLEQALSNLKLDCPNQVAFDLLANELKVVLYQIVGGVAVELGSLTDVEDCSTLVN
ncbi:hypothetical protein [Botryobacter ruber]|uniref:hypothetical protein n=1 Tax=Botryobacter ruber TaxID=2171629 RepID=UPI000FEC63FA|nr:hypothetical protein [Botryobacter ruber]